ncbi:triacylglycerol hydrolase DDHD2-like [Littorina saxatilis]|uniref:DDHD domain-containing protein n=1 Tax=Littorina saxatilis TaxID=31220 RepID=A0AAN9GKR5_9CAEN
MADKSKKEPTPPPLLYMPAGGGLTLNPPEPSGFLMPVVQSEPSLLDEDCEADSFVGQGPPAGAPPLGGGPLSQGGGAGPQGNTSYFQQGPSSGASDPFAQVGHFPPPQPITPSFGHTHTPASSSASTGFAPGPVPSTGQGQTSAPAPVSSAAATPPAPWAPTPADKGSSNMFRQKGPMRYAPPPSGTYASGTAPPQYTDPSAPPSFASPPPPPSGYAPAPFMTPGSSGSGSPLSASSPFPGTVGQPPSSTPYGQAPPPQGMMLPGVGLYHPVQYHWCYKKEVEGREIWYTFSRLDSKRLEERYQKEKSGGVPEVVSTDGGRYDVDVSHRVRRAVYWDEDPSVIQRCSWFYKREGDNRYVPYEEAQAERLEAEYKNALERNDWHKRIELPGKDTIVMHNPNVIVHFQASSQPDEWGNAQGDQMRPRVVKRGVEDFGTTEDGESSEVDHLVFVLHGIGDMCDVRFRNIVECVDDFRSISNGLIKSHFGPYVNSRHIHRVEFLPVHWHMAVHSEATGVDNRMKSITLPSTKKLRDFVNDTLLDILFYTSPAYCQIICDTVGREMNRLFQTFLARNPTFSGEVSVAGHSLGASILFDLLMNQTSGEPLDMNGLNGAADSFDDSVSEASLNDTPTEAEQEDEQAEEEAEKELTLEGLLEKVGLKEKVAIFHQEQIDLESLSMCSEQDLKDLGLPMGPRKKLQLLLQEEKGNKEKKTYKDLEKKIRKELEKKMKLERKKTESQQSVASQKKTQSSISVEYICGLAGTGQPFVRYPQLEFEPTCLFALGSPIGVFLSVRGVQQMGENFSLPTCSRFLNIFHPFDPVAYRIEPLINPSTSTIKPVLVPHYKGRKRLHLELKESISRMGTDIKQKIVDSIRSTWNTLNDFARAHRSDGTEGADGNQGLEKEVDQQVDSVMAEMAQHQDFDKSDTASICSSHDEEIPMGQLNEGRRVDYVLQEKPIESFNDYLFALTSHGCYWTSEDTVLLILKEIYSPLGITPIMPGPDGITPKPIMPPSAGPPPKSMAPYPGGKPSYPTHSGHAYPPMPHPHGPPTHPQGLPSHPPSMGVGPPPPPHMQGPAARFTPPPHLMGGPGSQSSSRGSTPPPSMPAASQAASFGPPPMAGFVRSKPQ